MPAKEFISFLNANLDTPPYPHTTAIHIKTTVRDMWPCAEVVLHVMCKQVDVPGSLLPGTAREVIGSGMLVPHLPCVRRVMLSQDGLSQRTWKEAPVNLGLVVDSAKSQCGQTVPRQIRRRSL